MRKYFYIYVVVFLNCFLLHPGSVYSDSVDNLARELSEEFEKRVPGDNSSVDSDYKLEQIALGTLYTTRILQLMYGQDKDMIYKINLLSEKYDRIIEQNKEIINLLKKIAADSSSRDSE